MWTGACTFLDVFAATLRPVTDTRSPTDRSLPRRRGLAARAWRRLDTLRVKLFVGIAGVNVLVVLLAYLVHGWSFDQGLSTYLDRSDEARLAPLVTRLGQEYAVRGRWQWLAEDHGAWHQLLAEELGLPLERGRPADGPRRPADPRGVATEGRLMLLDAARVPLFGDPQRLRDALLLPIEVRGERVGYLARPTRREWVESLEAAVSVQQGRQFAAIALGMVAAVLLNAALIARWFSGRLARVGGAAAAVAQGDYGVRLDERGHDELAHLTQDFNRMADSLQTAQQARQRWIADIAHELRTPLAGLQAEIEALQDGVRQPTPDRLASLAQQVQRLTRLVEDLRLLSLHDLGALACRTDPVDLGEWLGDFLDHPPVPCEGLSIHRSLATGVWVRADADRLQQVLSNLLQNTLRYCDAPAQLQVHLSRVDAQACLRWEDSPPGVPPDELERLTDRLYRGEASRARAHGGSGLGLAIARAIVEDHGGRMQASASALGGLAWEIRLPLAGEGVA